MLRAFTRELERGRGVLVGGPAGIGKSHAADTVAAGWEVSGRPVVRARATIGTRELPFGAFVGLLQEARATTTSLFVQIRQRLLADAGDRTLLLVVDDIDLLDEASASLVHHLVSDGLVALVATARTGALPPASITDLLHRGLLRGVEVPPLEVDGIAGIAEAVLGGPPDDRTVRLLHSTTGGNPLFVKELVQAATEQGCVTRRGGSVSLERLPLDAPRLVDVVRHRLQHLSPDELAVMRHIAFAEPCAIEELDAVATATADVLARLEAHGVITTGEDRPGLTIRIAHPLYGEVLRASTGLLQRRQILSALARGLAATNPTRPADLMKLARLSVDGGVEVDAKVLRRGMRMAVGSGLLDLAQRIGERLMAVSDSFADGYAMADALMFSGDLTGLRQHFEAWSQRATTNGEHRAVALVSARAECLIGAGRSRSSELLHQAMDRFPEPDGDWFPAGIDELSVGQSVFDIGWVPRSEILDRTLPLVDHPRFGTRVAALVAAGLADVLGGRPDTGLERIRRYHSELVALGPIAGVPTITVTVYDALAQAAAGDLAGAERYTAQLLSEATDDATFALASLYLGVMRGLSGRPVTALRDMESHLDRWDRVRGLVVARHRWLFRLFCAGSVGDIAAAQYALEQFRADSGSLRALDPMADLGHVRSLAADGQFALAARTAREAADQWRSVDHTFGETLCLYEVVRLGDPSTETRLAEIAASTEGTLAAMFAAHAAGLRADDAPGLSAVAEQLAGAGFTLYASEAAMHACDAFRRSGDQRAATRLLARAAELRSSCESNSTLAPVVDSGVAALSKREREVALLAAQGMTSREIATRLFISFRTAENHLAKAYDKLGVRTRVELSRVLGGGVAALVA